MTGIIRVLSFSCEAPIHPPGGGEGRGREWVSERTTKVPDEYMNLGNGQVGTERGRERRVNKLIEASDKLLDK